MCNKYRVLVLMSVYNGSRFLQDQINSILHQQNVIADILVRDDESKDDSMIILQKNAERYPGRITIISGQNMGSTKSFSKLLEISLTLPLYDYYAFSDQDDIWLSRKLFSAALFLDKYHDLEQPVGYCSNATLVDENLNVMRLMHIHDVKFTKESALLQNIATGCTMVFNIHAVRQYARQSLDSIKMHDHQMFLVCLFMGKFIYDNNSYIQYRQHASNQVGDMTFSARFRRRMKHLGESDNYYYTQSCNFLSTYQGELSVNDIKVIEVITKYKQSFYNKMCLLFNTKYHYDSLEFNMTMFLKTILGKL